MTFQELINEAIKKTGKQEQLAIRLDLAPSALSKRINGEIGWAEKEINLLLNITECAITCNGEGKKKITVLKEALRIIMEEQ